ncbi:MAG: hypothetical protein ACF8PN_07540 [Phycisphaerales bacterium]
MMMSRAWARSRPTFIALASFLFVLTQFESTLLAQECDPYIHWAVRSSLRDDMRPLPGQYELYYTMEHSMDLSGLPISRDIIDVPEAAFRIANCDPSVAMWSEADYNTYPEHGLHEIFDGLPGAPDYANWVENRDLFLAEYYSQVQCLVEHLVPVGGAYDKLVIDWETWSPLWSAEGNLNNGEQENWRECVRAINDRAIGGWDDQFLTEIVRYIPGVSIFDTLGTQDFTDLEIVDPDVAEDLLKTSWEHYAREFYTDSVNQFKMNRPELKVGFYFRPMRGGIIVTEHTRQLNDQLSWLWEIVDIFSPGWYATRWAWDERARLPEPPVDMEDCPGYQCFSTIHYRDYRDFYRTNIDELLRLKFQYGSEDTLLIPFVTWNYGKALSEPGDGCCEEYKRSFLNSINLEEQLVIPYQYVSSRYGIGLDGLAVWGYFPEDTEAYRRSIECELNTRWTDIFIEAGICSNGGGSMAQGDCLTLINPIRDSGGPNRYTFSVLGAEEGARVLIYWGRVDGLTPVPLCPLTNIRIGLALPIVSEALVATTTGQATVTVDAPVSISGKSLRFQAVELGSCRLSNVMRHTFR